MGDDLRVVVHKEKRKAVLCDFQQLFGRGELNVLLVHNHGPVRGAVRLQRLCGPRHIRVVLQKQRRKVIVGVARLLQRKVLPEVGYSIMKQLSAKVL
jgi:hypothetical protein